VAIQDYSQFGGTALSLTEADLANGRAKALSMWNGVSADPSTPSSISASTVSGIPNVSAFSTSMVEDAAYAFAIIEAAARIDTSYMALNATGVTPEVAVAIRGALPTALRIARDYGKWVVGARLRTTVRELNL
jgi:hypothetical protein